MSRDQPEPTLSTVFDEGHQTLLDDFTDATEVWDPHIELEDDAPTRDKPTQFYHGWETSSPTVRLTYIIPISVGTGMASQLRNYISEAQTIRRNAAHLMWAFERDQWGKKSPVNSVLKDSQYWKQNNINAANKQQNVNKVGEAFGAWEANDRTVETSALPQFGSQDYICIRGDQITVWDDASGLTIDIGGVRHDPPDPGRETTFPCVSRGGEYQQSVLEAIVDGTVSAGRSEIHEREEEWFVHLTISYTQPVYDQTALDRWIGIDLGTVSLYTAAVVEHDEESPKGNGIDVQHVSHGPGSELMADRRAQQQSLAYLQEQYGYDVASEKLGQRLAEHSKQLEHEYANEIVRLVEEYAPCGLVFENLKGIKGLGWSNLWAYFRFKQVITYKAQQQGLPTVTLDKRQTQHTSQDCSACERRTGTDDADGRITRSQFRCDACGYGPVDADSNAAINIAKRHIAVVLS